MPSSRSASFSTSELNSDALPLRDGGAALGVGDVAMSGNVDEVVGALSRVDDEDLEIDGLRVCGGAMVLARRGPLASFSLTYVAVWLAVLVSASCASVAASSRACFSWLWSLLRLMAFVSANSVSER